MVQRMERDAEVDALKSRLAAAEARAERAVGLLREAEQYGNFGCSDDFHGQIGCASDGGLILRDGWLARIDALLKEVAHGQQGSEMVEEAASALLACLDRHTASLAGLFGDLDLAVDALRAALALPADAPEGAGEAVALPMRGDVGKPEATRDPIFLLRWRPRNRPIRGDRWTVEGVWFTREEAEEFARGHAYRWGSDKHGPCWQVYCVPADGTLAALLRARTAYNVAKVPPLYAHPTPRAEAAQAEAVREACAKACDERAAESRRMEALCGSAKREWTDLDLQEEVTTEAVECAKACRSLPLPPGQASAGGMVDASLLPLVDGLLRDAEDAIAAHAGPGQHVGTPKVTVDALRLRNAARAGAHALRAKGAK